MGLTEHFYAVATAPVYTNDIKGGWDRLWDGLGGNAQTNVFFVLALVVGAGLAVWGVVKIVQAKVKGGGKMGVGIALLIVGVAVAAIDPTMELVLGIASNLWTAVKGFFGIFQ
jgi:hypothetical protein